MCRLLQQISSITSLKQIHGEESVTLYFENNAEGEKALEAFRTAESEYTQAYPVVMFYQFNCSLFARQCRQLNMMPPFVTMRQGKRNFTIQLPRVTKTPQIKRFIYKVRAPLLD